MTSIITTSGRPSIETIKLAEEAADILNYEYVKRNKRSISQLQQEYGKHVMVVGDNRFSLYRLNQMEPFFFHPNSAAFRVKRLLKNERDPLIEIARLLKGDTFLDCTLGFASDSIVASHVVGEEGRVVGIEANRDIAFMTERGLRSFETKSHELELAMSRITVVEDTAIQFLRRELDASWDIVYIDPMFTTPIKESSNFTALRNVGCQNALTEEWLKEALRVCKRGVVVKDSFDSESFKRFGLKQKVRPNTKFHFGILNKV